ncbi:hypothetical protein BRC89_12715 [Halobacteriales archaeon QS_4_70_19]|nr:MAG: hypothetical protein BRC89_12715 [Halobacteriales archaeon QS_4_70_19]
MISRRNLLSAVAGLSAATTGCIGGQNYTAETNCGEAPREIPTSETFVSEAAAYEVNCTDRKRLQVGAVDDRLYALCGGLSAYSRNNGDQQWHIDTGYGDPELSVTSDSIYIVRRAAPPNSRSQPRGIGKYTHHGEHEWFTEIRGGAPTLVGSSAKFLAVGRYSDVQSENGYSVSGIDKNSGRIVWTVETGGISPHRSSGLVRDGTLYVTDSFSVYSIDLATGDRNWERDLSSDGDIDGIAGVEGVLVFGGDWQLLDTTTGKTKWRRSVAPAAGKVRLGEEAIYYDDAGDITAMSYSGDRVWKRSTCTERVVSLLEGDNTIVVNGRSFVGFDKDRGELKWRNRITGSQESYSDGNALYVLSDPASHSSTPSETDSDEQSRILKIDIATGEYVYSFGSESHPIGGYVSSGDIYVLEQDGRLNRLE